MRLARFVIALSALTYGAVAVGFLTAPAELAALVGLAVDNATADNDVRAVYGGVALGLTLFFARSFSRPDWHAPALGVAILTLGSMAAARFLSWALVGLPEPVALALHAGEVGGCLLASVALYRRRRA